VGNGSSFKIAVSKLPKTVGVIQILDKLKQASSMLQSSDN